MTNQVTNFMIAQAVLVQLVLAQEVRDTCKQAGRLQDCLACTPFLTLHKYASELLWVQPIHEHSMQYTELDSRSRAFLHTSRLTL